jgi:S-adenosylmethionine-diacylglycerol 3-amino-3-carboxypropyl transferase
VTELNPAENPYYQWILMGRHDRAAAGLRPEHFETIRANLDRLEWHRQSIEEFLASSNTEPIDRYNLSDIFEYMSEANYHQLLDRLVRHGDRAGGWRTGTCSPAAAESMADRLESMSELAARLFLQDKAAFIVASLSNE